jgi:hypothetical protein
LNPSESDVISPICRSSRESAPSKLERDDAKGAAKSAKPRLVDTDVDTKGAEYTAIDVTRAVALAMALEPFVSAEVRPLARELVELLKAAQPSAGIVSIFERTRK